jgi:hypothetical protein
MNDEDDLDANQGWHEAEDAQEQHDSRPSGGPESVECRMCPLQKCSHEVVYAVVGTAADAVPRGLCHNPGWRGEKGEDLAQQLPHRHAFEACLYMSAELPLSLDEYS